MSEKNDSETIEIFEKRTESTKMIKIKSKEGKLLEISQDAILRPSMPGGAFSKFLEMIILGNRNEHSDTDSSSEDDEREYTNETKQTISLPISFIVLEKVNHYFIAKILFCLFQNIPFKYNNTFFYYLFFKIIF